MPDPNKLDALRLVGFRVRDTCGLCRHATFKAGSDWGTCSQIQYRHMKHSHSGMDREASIHRSGHCPSFETDQAKKQDLERSGFLALREHA